VVRPQPEEPVVSGAVQHEPPVLRVTGLAVSFGAVQVLSDVDLEVPEGSFTAVLGSSGSGKTTLLRCVGGFERPGAGTIEVAGRTVDGPGRHVAPERRRLGYVPQEGALFPHLTVAGNVGFGLRSRAGRRPRVAELLELVGLAGYDRRFPHELSGGQQQRVALARALALKPALVLLDEPFSSLDAALRLSVRSDIARVLRESGSTVVLVTHDQQEAMSLADRVAVLREGRIAQVGTPRELYLRPVDAEMASFVGEANLVAATVSGSEATTALGVLTTGPHPQDGRAVVLVRPEQISVVADAAGAAGALSAVVVEQSYLGHDSMLTVRPLADCGSDRLRVRVTGPADFPVGSRVRLTASGAAPTWPAPD
jgi:iron(III) transport system ATP-binding protein